MFSHIFINCNVSSIDRLELFKSVELEITKSNSLDGGIANQMPKFVWVSDNEHNNLEKESGIQSKEVHLSKPVQLS